MVKPIKLKDPLTKKEHEINIIKLIIIILVTLIVAIFLRANLQISLLRKSYFSLIIGIGAGIIYVLIVRFLLFKERFLSNLKLDNEEQAFTKEGAIFFGGFLIFFSGLFFGDDFPVMMILINFIGLITSGVGVRLQYKKEHSSKYVLNNRRIFLGLWIVQIILSLVISIIVYLQNTSF